MGLPHFHNYYIASHLTRVIDWHCHGNSKDWVALEAHSSPTPLPCNSPLDPMAEPQTIPKKIPFDSTTLHLFLTVTQKKNLNSMLSPLTPLRNNPDFRDLEKCILKYKAQTYPYNGKLFPQGPNKNFTAFKIDNRLVNLLMWSYFQISSYANHKTRKPFFSREMTDLEEACARGMPQLRIDSEGSGQGFYT